MKHSVVRNTIILLAAAISTSIAQEPVTTRRLGPTVAGSKELIGGVWGVRQLRDGRVLVNDPVKRRLVVFDSTLAGMTVLADSTSGGANSHGSQPGALIPNGDSTLFVDATALSFLVIGPDGVIGRVMSAPRSSDVTFLTLPNNGVPAIDAKGRLVYRGIGRPGPMVFEPGKPVMPPTPPDSAPVLRVDLATRKLDTVVWIKTPKITMTMTTLPNGGMMMSSITNPMPVVDDWAVLADGSIAIIRGRDYHIDWRNADGSATSSAKIPYDWQRLTDDDKVAVIDSAKKAIEAVRALATNARRDSTAGRGGDVGGRGGEGGGVRIVMGAGDAMIGGARGGPVGPMPVELVSPSELPDYRPVFRSGSARPDLEGNIWIQTTQGAGNGLAGGFTYDVINRRGELVDRVQIPAGRTVAGFGPGGIVYLSARDGAGVRLEKARIR